MIDGEEVQGHNLDAAVVTERRAPVGEVKLGSVDPRDVTLTDFRSRRELLFHGGASSSFHRDYDYTQAAEHSGKTIGQGYYTTSSREFAESYSRLRLKGQQAEPHVVEILPFEARMLDMRAKDDLMADADVPLEFATDFWRFLRKTSERIDVNDPKMARVVNSLVRIRASVCQLVAEKRRFNIKQMIGLDGDPTKTEALAGIFTEFMFEQGYDGLIFNEGGDDVVEQRGRYPSYVFYNSNVIGDYDTWRNTPRVESIVPIDNDTDARAILQQVSSKEID